MAEKTTKKPPAKGAKPASKKKEGNDFLKPDEALQAILLADSFMTKLRPITLERPKVLLPLVNVPMLDYTLEFLEAGGVKEIFVVSCSHAEQIESYLSNSKWTKRPHKLAVRSVTVPDAFSAGDALRRVYTMQLIRSDPFVLISGDVISNLRLDQVLEAHRQRRLSDKSWIMTVVMKKAAPKHRTRSLDEDLVVAIDSQTQQLLVYDNNPTKAILEMEPEIFNDHPEIEFHHDLLDCHIDICSPEVLSLFNTHFDFGDIRKEFIHGVLSEEIMGDKLAVHLINQAYAARVHDFRTYDSVSKDIIQRWTHPMVPDNNLAGQFATSYRVYHHKIYKENKVVVPRSCVIQQNSVIGENSQLGENSFVTNSVIGRGSIIGRNVRIVNSYLWGNNVIEDGAVLDHCILAQGARVKRNARLDKGCVLSFNVVIGEGFQLPAYSKITTQPAPGAHHALALNASPSPSADSNISSDLDDLSLDDSSDHSDDDMASTRARAPASLQRSPDEFDESLASVSWSESEVGHGGIGRRYDAKGEEEDEEDEDADQKPPTYLINSIAPDLSLWQRPSNAEDEGSESEDEEEDDIEDSEAYQQDDEKFYQEMNATLQRGETENLPVDAIFLEMQALKLAHDASLLLFAATAFLSLFNLIEPIAPGAKPNKKQLNSLTRLLKKWNLIFRRFSREQQDQVMIVNGLERAAQAHEKQFIQYFRFSLQILYESEVLSEDAILEWEELKRASGSPDELELLRHASEFLEWLKEAEEDEDDEDEDDDDD